MSTTLKPCPHCGSPVTRDGMTVICDVLQNGCGAIAFWPICSTTNHVERLWNERAKVDAHGQTEAKDGTEETPMDEDFCIIHGYEFMRSQHGNPIAFCSECERERGPNFVTCEDCVGLSGQIEIREPQPDDPYYCRVINCPKCNGTGFVEADSHGQDEPTESGAGSP